MTTPPPDVDTSFESLRIAASFARFVIADDPDAAELTINTHRDRAQLGEVCALMARMLAILAAHEPLDVDAWLEGHAREAAQAEAEHG